MKIKKKEQSEDQRLIKVLEKAYYRLRSYKAAIEEVKQQQLAIKQILKVAQNRTTPESSNEHLTHYMRDHINELIIRMIENSDNELQQLDRDIYDHEF